MNDGSIRVGTKLDLSGIKSDIKKLESELKAAQKEADKLSAKEAKVKETFSAEREIDAEVDKKFSHGDDIDAREAEALAEINAKQAELNQKTQEYTAMLDQLNAKLQQQSAIAQASKELDGAVKSEAVLDKITTQEQYNSLLEETKAKMQAIEDMARQIADANGVSYEALLSANPTYQKLSDTMGVLTSTTREFESEADAAGDTSHRAFRKSRKEADNLSKSIEKGIKKIGRMALAVFGIRGAYSLVRRAVSACLESNEELSRKMTAIWNALGAIIEPVVETMINAIYKILAYINYFVKAITGIDFVARANAKALAKQSAATDKLTKSTREANKALAAFDEMNVLQDNGSTAGLPTVDQAATLDLPELTEEEMENIDAIIGIYETVSEAIDWCVEKCKDLVTWFTELDTKTQILIGILGVAGLVGVFIGGGAGVSVFGSVLAVVGAIEGLNLLITGDTTDAVNGFITLLGVGGLAGILIGGTTGVTVWASITAIALLLLGFNLLLNGDTTEALVGIIALLGGAGLAGYLWFGVKGMAVGIAIGSLMILIDGFVKLFSGDLYDALEGVLEILIGSAGLIVAFKTFKGIIDGKSGVQAVMSALTSPLFWCVAGFAILAAGILYLSKNWGKMDGAQRAVTLLVALAAAVAAAAIAVGIFQTAWTLGVGAAAIAAGLALLGLTFAFTSGDESELANSGKAMADEFYASSDFTTSPLPKLATGGIVNRPGRGVHAIVGEAGAEAVLPLENNTEWMDVLAEKIGGNVTIPIYMDGKKIATYVVDIQKKRAFAMNGV